MLDISDAIQLKLHIV